MPAVSDVVRKVAQTLEIDQPVVNLFARRLIDASMLPKSLGRAIAAADASHVAWLVIAVMATEKSRHAPRAAQVYGAMPVTGSTNPRELPWDPHTEQGSTFHDVITRLFEDETSVMPESQVQDGEIVVNRSWPEATIRWTDGGETRFAPVGAKPRSKKAMRVDSRISGIDRVVLGVWPKLFKQPKPA